MLAALFMTFWKVPARQSKAFFASSKLSSAAAVSLEGSFSGFCSSPLNLNLYSGWRKTRRALQSLMRMPPPFLGVPGDGLLSRPDEDEASSVYIKSAKI